MESLKLYIEKGIPSPRENCPRMINTETYFSKVTRLTPQNKMLWQPGANKGEIHAGLGFLHSR